VTDGPDVDRRRLRAAFDGVAERYDAVRPRYPAAVVDDLVTRAGLGHALAGVARRNLAAFPNARVVIGDLAELTVARRRWAGAVPHRWRRPVSFPRRSAPMATAAIRPFRRTDRDQVTALVNAHAQAVVPGVSVSVNTVLDRLERDPGDYLVDPWVTERTTLVAEQRGRVSAAAHLIRYGSGPEVGEALRDTAEIRWLLCWTDSPVWPDASAAGHVLTAAAVAVLRRWDVRRISADGTLPAPGVYGVPEQWPHVRALLERAGFVGNLHVHPAHRRRDVDPRRAMMSRPTGR
jgi:hypothetical protein